MEEIVDIKKYARKNQVPIMKDDGMDFICSYIREHNVKRVLEIGTAIGYSAIQFAKVRDDVTVLTIEREIDKVIRAKQNFHDNGLEDRITVLNEDLSFNKIIEVTDENGKNVKDDNGEYETKPIALKHALVIGDRIECPKFSLVIPKGWSNKMSFADLIITRDGTKDVVKISTTEGKTSVELSNEKVKALNNIKSLYPGSEFGAREVSIRDDIKGEFSYVYVADTGARDEELNILSSYVGFIVFRNGSSVYSCMITSDRDVSDQIDEIVEILGTMEFVGE